MNWDLFPQFLATGLLTGGNLRAHRAGAGAYLQIVACL